MLNWKVKINMKLISWNVNGIRAALKKGARQSFLDFNADIICLQEVRALPEQFELDLPEYTTYWYPAEKKGYSGTGILTKVPFKNVTRGLGVTELDTEGRVISAELDDYYLVTVYTPNSQRGLTRLDYRVNQWDRAFKTHLKNLEKSKPVIFCGDLNVAHKEIDLANPKANQKNAGFTPEERASFSGILDSGFVDTFREFCDEGGHYSWWSNFGKSRERNIGWRIDYFGVSEILKPRLLGAQIHPTVMGSDHCPVSLEIA